MTWHLAQENEAVRAKYGTWTLDRPKPALPNSYFWTWDHSTNWVLDDPGLQNAGCHNRYLKQPETYLQDYRMLTDLAAGLGIKGIVIWGFLRESHGGVEMARRVAAYAASRGVSIMPGVGTTWYGGVFYEGDHRYSLSRFLKKCPDARMLDENGAPREIGGAFGACLAHPAYREWLAEALNWLYEEFPIGGVNLENGDMLVDHHPSVKALREGWPADDPEAFFHQGMSYRQALDAIGHRLPDTLATYATYTGFNYGDVLQQNTSMGRKPPAMLRVLPDQAVCQWTLTGMLLKTALPLTAYLDDGAPRAVFENPNWPADLRPTNVRSVGFMHQGSQWSSGSDFGRYACIVSDIKEACLRAHRAGLEGVGIHGEVTSRYVPWALNYLAFSHFTHWPEDTMLDFGRKTLSQVLGSEKDGEDFAVVLSHWDAGSLTDDLRLLANPRRRAFGFSQQNWGMDCRSVAQQQQCNFWMWLHGQATRDTGRRDSPPMLTI